MTRADDDIDSIRSSLGRGDLLAAYDLVVRAQNRDDERVRYLEVLTLARLGDTDRALRLYDVYSIGSSGGVDALSLQARLLKDLGFRDGSRPNKERLLEACRIYSAIYRKSRSSYPAINAATLAQIAGRPRLASLLARSVLQAEREGSPQDYYSLATRAEAKAILGDFKGARIALVKAISSPDADAGARSTTLLQLQRLLPAVAGSDAMLELLDLISPPNIAMFCGNIFLPDAKLEDNLAARVRNIIDRENIGYGYGALAAGSDILIAEQLIRSGAELHVVLPFNEADFLTQSVAPGGDDWLRRYEECKARAASLTLASRMKYVGDGSQFAYGSKVTMGLARLRARHLHNQAVQLAIVENSEAETLSGSDIGAWKRSGGKSFVIEAGPLRRPIMPPSPDSAIVQRVDCGLMFTDYPGFSELDERVLPTFWEEVMMRGLRLLRQFSDKVLHSNTWGDALFAVFRDASAAAAAATELCEVFTHVDCAALGVPEGTSMRIALHFGPIYVQESPPEEAMYFGSEIALAARIEPVTPAGSVYVTEPFAAILEMETDDRFTCNYVGRLALPKNYGVFPIYRLSRREVVASA